MASAGYRLQPIYIIGTGFADVNLHLAALIWAPGVHSDGDRWWPVENLGLVGISHRQSRLWWVSG